MSVRVRTCMHTFPVRPCLCVSVSLLLALSMSAFMYVVSIYYHSSAPKGTSTHTEMKRCNKNLPNQWEGREGNVSEADQ